MVKCCVPLLPAVYCGEQRFFMVQGGEKGMVQWQPAGLCRGPCCPCCGGPDGGATGMCGGSAAPSCFVPVYASPHSLPLYIRPCQDPSFGSLIISASLPHCMCNDLFTSLCRLPLPDGALPKDRGRVVFLLALPAPTHCLAQSGPN